MIPMEFYQNFFQHKIQSRISEKIWYILLKEMNIKQSCWLKLMTQDIPKKSFFFIFKDTTLDYKRLFGLYSRDP